MSQQQKKHVKLLKQQIMENTSQEISRFIEQNKITKETLIKVLTDPDLLEQYKTSTIIQEKIDDIILDCFVTSYSEQSDYSRHTEQNLERLRQLHQKLPQDGTQDDNKGLKSTVSVHISMLKNILQQLKKPKTRQNNRGGGGGGGGGGDEKSSHSRRSPSPSPTTPKKSKQSKANHEQQGPSPMLGMLLVGVGVVAIALTFGFQQ